MTVIFSRVEAQIAGDLISKFPTDFDFDTMLRKVCDDAGVDLEIFIDNEGTEASSQNYKLKGLWLAMERTYHYLVTTLGLYSSRTADSEVTNIDIASDGIAEILDYSISGLGDKVCDDKEKDTASNHQCSENDMFDAVLEGSKNRAARRPRKSAIQSRRFISDITSKEILNEEEGSFEFSEGKSDDNEEETQGIDEYVGKENSCKLLKGEKKQNEEKLPHRVPTKLDCIKKPLGKKRGRPRKYKEESACQFQCAHCTFVGKDKSELRSHVNKMHKSSPSSCDICLKVFPNKRYMMRHKSSHGQPQHCCDMCGKMYKTKKAMIDHRKTHDSSYTKPSFKCDECPKSFCTQYILDCHVRDIHKGLRKSYLCSVCGKSFTTKHSLTEHSNAHNGVKPYACDICDKKFSYESALRDHKYSHLESKQFWCRHCQKSFSQRSGLKMHMRTHMLRKMFTCVECGRGFTQKQALQRHERVHKGEKPYICKHCGKYFTDASIIRRHLILVHKIEKSRDVWREDIVCTIITDSDHHVQKIEDEESRAKIENEKEEILQRVGLKSKSESTKKGPSRAFQRYYPPRVVILDEQENIVEPEISISDSMPSSDIVTKAVSNITTSNNTVLQLKAQPTHFTSGTALIETSEAGLEIDSAPHLLNQRFIDPNQWDPFTSQLKAVPATQFEQIIADDPTQTDVSRNLDQVQNLQKLIKCEDTPLVSVETTVPQEEFQSTQDQNFSPVQLNPLVLSGNQFEALAAQLNQSHNQYYDIRVSNHSAPVPWAPVCFYPHRATPLGISSDIPYLNTPNSSVTHVTSCVLPSSTVDFNHISTSSLILDKTNQETVSDISSVHPNTIPSGLHSTASSNAHHLPSLLEPHQHPGPKMDSKNHVPHATSIIINTGGISSVIATHNPTEPAKCNDIDPFFDK